MSNLRGHLTSHKEKSWDSLCCHRTVVWWLGCCRHVPGGTRCAPTILARAYPRVSPLPPEDRCDIQPAASQHPGSCFKLALRAQGREQDRWCPTVTCLGTSCPSHHPCSLEQALLFVFTLLFFFFFCHTGPHAC
jgi:hypothetical protein